MSYKRAVLELRLLDMQREIRLLGYKGDSPLFKAFHEELDRLYDIDAEEGVVSMNNTED